MTELRARPICAVCRRPVERFEELEHLNARPKIAGSMGATTCAGYHAPYSQSHEARGAPAEGETMMSSAQVRITYAGETVTMTWDGAQASAPILVDGDATGYQTADARHRTGDAVRLVCQRVWGTVYETREAAEADGHGEDAHVTVWDDVAYETVDGAS